MPTNKIVLRTIEEFMSDYVPVYQPLYPLLLGGKSQQYPLEAGRMDFRRVNAIGDIRAHHITPKDTEIRQIAVQEGKKSFKKYFLANQYTQSDFQDRQGVEEVVAQVLDEHQVQMDELVLLGDGTSPGTVLNNGLYYSSDVNYKLNGSVQVALTNRLYDFHAKVISTAMVADQVAGRKVIVFFGTGILPVTNTLYDGAAKGWRQALQEVLGPNYSIVTMPDAITPAGSGGWLIVNLDQVKLHYTVLPAVHAQGQNEEKMYIWTNFLIGSAMVEVLAPGAIIRQPATLET